MLSKEVSFSDMHQEWLHFGRITSDSINYFPFTAKARTWSKLWLWSLLAQMEFSKERGSSLNISFLKLVNKKPVIIFLIFTCQLDSIEGPTSVIWSSENSVIMTPLHCLPSHLQIAIIVCRTTLLPFLNSPLFPSTPHLLY